MALPSPGKEATEPRRGSTGDPSGTRIGRFEIIRALGKGSMGTVYLARDPVLDRKVAVKTLADGLSVSPAELSLLRRRLLNEARSAGTLRHPGIVTIYEVVEEDGGRVAIAMEYVEGETLAERLRQGKLLPLRQVVEITAQLAETLDHAHERDVVHRDVKPANIILTADGDVKIADFGIASLRGEDLASELNALGTPNYLAPERILGTPADRTSDLYALGVVVYEMVTGGLPFRGKTMGELARSVVRDEPADPLAVRPDLPERVAALLSKALAKEPEERFATASAMARELAASVEVEAAFSATVKLPTPEELGLEVPASSPLAVDPALFSSPGTQAAGSKTAHDSRAPWPRRLGVRSIAAGALGLVALVALLGYSVDALEHAVSDPASPRVEPPRAVVDLAEANWLARAGDLEAALTELERAAGSSIDREQLEAEGARLRAVAMARLEAELEAEARANFEEAQRAFERRDLGSTERALEALREIDPDHEGGAAMSAALEVVRGALRRLPERPPVARPVAAPSEGAAKTPALPAFEPFSPSPAETPPPPRFGTLRIDFQSLVPRGVLTVYAGQEQIVRRSFRFVERSGLLRRQATSGGFDTGVRLPAGPTELRVYLALPGRETLTSRLDLDLEGGALRTLRLRLAADATLEAEIF